MRYEVRRTYRTAPVCKQGSLSVIKQRTARTEDEFMDLLNIAVTELCEKDGKPELAEEKAKMVMDEVLRTRSGVTIGDTLFIVSTRRVLA